MPHISACIGSIEDALASIAKWPTSCARAIHRWSSSRLRMVWYLLRSILVLRAASARAAASEIGVRGCVSGLPAPCARRGALAPPLRGSVGAEGEPLSNTVPLSRAASLAGLPASGGGANTLAPLL